MGDLAALLQAACEGDREDVISFLKAFVNSELVVPEKEQSPAISALPSYPNRPLNILAVRDGELVIVPAFSSEDLVENWSSRPLRTRKIKTKELINILPEDWHLALNPNSDFRKDFSPWELQKLLEDEDGIQEIATELEIPHGVEPLEIKRVAKDDLIEVKSTLNALIKEIPEIREIYLSIEIGQTFEASQVETLLVGLKLKDVKPKLAEEIRTKIKDSLNPLLIGGIQLRVLIGVGFSDLEIGVFADIPPEIIREDKSC